MIGLGAFGCDLADRNTLVTLDMLLANKVSRVKKCRLTVEAAPGHQYERIAADQRNPQGLSRFSKGIELQRVSG